MRANVTTAPFVSVRSLNPFAHGPSTEYEAVQELTMDEWVALKEGLVPRKTEWPPEKFPPISSQAVHSALKNYFNSLQETWRDLPVTDRERIRRRIFTREMMTKEGEVEFAHILWPERRKFFPYWAAGALVYLFYESEREDVSDRFDARHLQFLRTVIEGYETVMRDVGRYFSHEEWIYHEHLGAFGLHAPTLLGKYRGRFPMTVKELRLKILQRVELYVPLLNDMTHNIGLLGESAAHHSQMERDDKLVAGLAVLLRQNFDEAASSVASVNRTFSVTSLQRVEWILDTLEGKSLVWRAQCQFEEVFHKKKVLPWWHFSAEGCLQRGLLQSYIMLCALGEAKEKSLLFSHWLVQKIFFHETVNETVPWSLFCRDLADYLNRICRELTRCLDGDMGRTDLESYLGAADAIVGLGSALKGVDTTLWEIFRKETVRLSQVEPADLVIMLAGRVEKKIVSAA